MALPPTSSKISTDANEVTTFKFDFPNFTGTHTGINLSLGINSVQGGGTGLATLTANNVILGNGTSTPQFVAPGSFGNLLISDGTTWTSGVASGSSSFVSYASSQVTTDSTALTGGTFTTFNNSPAFTFTPTITGTYKVYFSAPFLCSASQYKARVFNTSGGATLLEESQAGNSTSVGISADTSEYAQSVYALTAGTTYVFDIQASVNVGSTTLAGSTICSFYMFAEGIGLINSPGLSVTITTAALTTLGTQGSMTFVNGILTAQTQAT